MPHFDINMNTQNEPLKYIHICNSLVQLSTKEYKKLEHIKLNQLTICKREGKMSKKNNTPKNIHLYLQKISKYLPTKNIITKNI